MNTETTHATPNQREAIGLALARIIPTDLTEAEAVLLLEKIEEVVAVAAPIALKIVRPPPKPKIKITIVDEFELDGQRFDAVLVHQTDEDRVLGEEAIRRADEDRPDAKVVRSEEDWEYAYARRNQLPSKLNDYWLVTARPRPDCPRYVSCLSRHDRGWCEVWGVLALVWSRRALLLRRRT